MNLNIAVFLGFFINLLKDLGINSKEMMLSKVQQVLVHATEFGWDSQNCHNQRTLEKLWGY